MAAIHIRPPVAKIVGASTLKHAAASGLFRIRSRAEGPSEWGALVDAGPSRVYVDCATCKRSGRDTVTSLIDRYGADISTLDLLRHLMAPCRNQRAPGAPPARKYEHLCLAALTLPPAAEQITPVPLGVPYSIEVGDQIGGKLEPHLATFYPLSVAIAALEAACLEWPTNEVTLRDRAQILRNRELPPLIATE